MRFMRSTLLTVFAVCLALASTPFARAVEEPAGFRMEEYRAPVPTALTGARVISTEEAEALWRAGDAIFVDVLPRPPMPELPEGTVWREPPHSDIPGSVWLADVGFGSLSPEMEEWYRESLERLTGGDLAQPLVLYCRSDCWMSWNAGKRAIGWGYTGILWYPGGIESWEAAGLPLEERTPEPRPEEPAD